MSTYRCPSCKKKTTAERDSENSLFCPDCREQLQELTLEDITKDIFPETHPEIVVETKGKK